MTPREAWLAWFREAEQRFDDSMDHVLRILLNDGRNSEGLQEAVSAANWACLKWEAALIAHNAFMAALEVAA